MPRVSIKYQNGTSVEADCLSDAIIHLMHTGLDYVEEITEDQPSHVVCDKCEGTGVVDGPKAQRVMTRKQAEDKVREIDSHAPRSESSFDDRVAVTRSLVNDDD